MACGDSGEYCLAPRGVLGSDPWAASDVPSLLQRWAAPVPLAYRLPARRRLWRDQSPPPSRARQRKQRDGRAGEVPKWLHPPAALPARAEHRIQIAVHFHSHQVRK
jgi:hypothetical protein